MIKVSTETGSKYEIDVEAGIWHRVLRTESSGRISVECGPFTAYGNMRGGPVTVGEPMLIEKVGGRFLRTSHVVAVEGIEE